MSPGISSAPWAGRHKGLLTLGATAVVAVVMAMWGLSALTAPFPNTGAKSCGAADQVVDKTMTRREVTVSVYNAGAKAGTAKRISTALARLGFHIGNVGNAPTGVTVPILEVAGSTVTDPATKLVAATFGSTATVTSDPALQIGPGVNIFIGPRHGGLVKHPPREMALPNPIVTCLTS